MLFAAWYDSPVLWTGVGTALGGVLGWLLKWKGLGHQTRRENRTDAMDEYRTYIDLIEKRLAYVEQQERECAKKLAALVDRYADVKAENRVMQAELVRLQQHTGLPAAVTPLSPVVVTATLDGTMREVTPSAAGLLGWTAEELTGLNVDVLVPPRLRGAHRAALLNRRESGTAGWVGQTLDTYSLHRDGHEVAVRTVLSPARGKDGTELVSAEIRPRVEASLEERRQAKEESGIGKARPRPPDKPS